MMNDKIPCPTEAAEQTALMRWAFYEQGAYPELEMLYHIPNEGKRSAVTGAHMRMQGMKSGVPDMHLPVARGQYHSLYVEMKRRNGETPSRQQAEWLDKLASQGHCVCWCRGWDAAASVIEAYLKTGRITYAPTRGRAGQYHAGGQTA